MAMARIVSWPRLAVLDMLVRPHGRGSTRGRVRETRWSSYAAVWERGIATGSIRNSSS